MALFIIFLILPSVHNSFITACNMFLSGLRMTFDVAARLRENWWRFQREGCSLEKERWESGWLSELSETCLITNVDSN